MSVWVLTADNHCYDANSSWFVGVYSTLDKAAAGARIDILKYAKENGGIRQARGSVNYSLVEATVDGTVIRGVEINAETGEVWEFPEPDYDRKVIREGLAMPAVRFEKVSDGVYRLPITAGEYIGIFRSGKSWVVSHPRHNETCESFASAKEVARTIFAGLS